MPVPNIFASATSAIPLSQLDQNFATAITLGNTAVYLGNTTTSLGNVTLTNVTISSGNVTVSAGSNTSPSITTVGDTNTGIYFPAADTIGFTEGGVESMRIDASGNMGLGVTPSAWGAGPSLQIGGIGVGSRTSLTSLAQFSANQYWDGAAHRYIATNFATLYTQNAGAHTWSIAASGTAGNTISFTTAMTLDASGNLGVGTSSPQAYTGFTVLTVDNATNGGVFTVRKAGVAKLNVYADDNFGFIEGVGSSIGLKFLTNNAVRATIDTSGNFGVGQAPTLTINGTAGVTTSPLGYMQLQRSSGVLLAINRTTDDGNLVEFYQANTLEGNISVSGTTVSYNGGHLSRYAQTTTAKDNSLVKGTVLSNLDEMNVYTDAEGNPVDNEQLNKVKVSDVEGDANVAGVFVNWSHDDDHDVDEINMAMTGDMIIRIAQGTTVQRGDLLMSAGNGTAKPQGDDIVRSKTIAKVTSNHVTCTYADGSYCVPCVLMAC